MNNTLDKTYEWISWETSTHYCISQWNGDTIKNKWINKGINFKFIIL